MLFFKWNICLNLYGIFYFRNIKIIFFLLFEAFEKKIVWVSRIERILFIIVQQQLLYIL